MRSFPLQNFCGLCEEEDEEDEDEDEDEDEGSNRNVLCVHVLQPLAAERPWNSFSMRVQK